MDEVRICIIGAGVVGLSIAAALAERWDDIVVLEKNDSFGRETSSRNSEVIHSGIYYAPGSLKAALCREGADLIYRYCEEFHVPVKRLGKLILASNDSEVVQLKDLEGRGKRNSVELWPLDAKDINRLEPEVKALAGIYLPDTGIIDSHALMDRLYQQALAAGVVFAFNTAVRGLEQTIDGFILRSGDDSFEFKSRVIINSAGLHADSIASLAGIDIKRCGYDLKFCKGSYFAYARPSPVNHLIYPVPHEDLAGLGVHATLDLGHRLRFGPDVEFVDQLDYAVDDRNRDSFFQAAAKIVKNIEREAMQPHMAGVRPKLSGPGDPVRDFVVAEESSKGVPGLVSLVGIESPGLTSCLAIGRMVVKMVERLLN
jgi:L-2-hydroxyglutarate oxidase LhgO